jgi:GT2 family glycosyltransferase
MPEASQSSSTLTGNKQTVCAVVVTYNRLGLLKECVAGLRGQTRCPDRILIVNNGSTDGTIEWLADQDDLWVIHQENLGASGGFYRGMKEAASAGCEWIWVMDDDVTPFPDALSRLLQGASEVGGKAIVVPSRRNTEGECLNAERVVIDYSTWLKDDGPVRIRDLYGSQSPCNPLQIDGFTFEGPMFPSWVVSAVGLPDPSYFLIGDDTDYAIRCKGKCPVFFVPDACFVRQIAEVAPHEVTIKDYYMVRNAYTAMALRYGAFPSKYVRPLIRALAFARNRFIIHRVPVSWGAARLLFLGLFDGYCGRLGRRS